MREWRLSDCCPAVGYPQLPVQEHAQKTEVLQLCDVLGTTSEQHRNTPDRIDIREANTSELACLSEMQSLT